MMVSRRRVWQVLRWAFLALLLLVVPALGIRPTPVRAVDAAITFVCCAYTPSVVYINAGDTVTWQGDFTSHPLVSDAGLWTTQSTGATFSHTFAQAGSYRFHCAIHGGAGGVGMSGQVHVLGPLKLFLPITMKP